MKILRSSAAFVAALALTVGTAVATPGPSATAGGAAAAGNAEAPSPTVAASDNAKEKKDKKDKKDKGEGGDPAVCTGALACGPALAAMLDLEARIDDHLWYGLVVPIDYATSERVRGNVARITAAWGDAGIWSGSYLGAQSYRYAVAKHRLAATDVGTDGRGDRAFWQAQLDEAGDRVDALIAQVDLRTYIARAWQTETDVAVDPSAVPPGVDFGGGIIQGTPGMLMYSCAPVDAPSGFGMPSGGDVKGPFTWVNDLGREDRMSMPEGDYTCEASTTRDAYAGTLFGLVNAFDLVGPHDAAVRDLVGDDILVLADYLVRNGWTTTRPHGQVAVPPFGDWYDGAITPTMIISPSYRLAISAAALHVAEQIGSTEDALRWRGIWQAEFAAQLPLVVVENEVYDPTPQAGYFQWNLAHLVYAVMLRTVPDGDARAALAATFAIVDRQTGDDVNAFFEAVTYEMTGEPARLDAATAHTEEWLDYRRRIDLGGETNNTAKCGVSLTCVPEDQWDIVTMTPAGPIAVTVPGSSSTLRSVTPIPIADRVPSDFLWQRTPFTSMDGWVGVEHQEPGIDYLLPYWMLRYRTEVGAPALRPFPTWPAPGYSDS